MFNTQIGLIAAAVALTTCLAAPARAQVPGDECGDCFPASVGTYFGSTADNTGTLDDTSCGIGDVIDEWYCFTAPTSGVVVADTCGLGTNFDTTLAVFTSCLLEFELDCNDDWPDCGLQSLISWEVGAGTTYFIRVSGYNGAVGEYELTIAYPGPEGDECEDAFPVGEGTFTGTTTDNTGVFDDTTCGYDDIIDEWYAFTAPQSGIVTADTCGAGTNFDTTLAVFTSCLLEFELDCNDDWPDCDLQSLISWEVGAGTTYFIRVSGFDGAVGDYELHIYYPVTGDECEEAFPVAEGAFFGTTTDNTGTIDDTSCGSGDVIDEWYAYTASLDGVAMATMCSIGATFDTTLAVFDACGGTELACNDDYCGLLSQISWPVTAGMTYFVRVAGYGGEVGDYGLSILSSAGEVDFYLFQAEFEGLVQQGGMTVIGSEDFEEAILPAPPQNFAVMDDPLDATTNNGVYQPGDIIPGWTFQSNLEAPGVSGLNPRGVEGLGALGPGYVGVPDTTIIPIIVEDSFDVGALPVPTPDPSAVGMEIVALDGLGLVVVHVFDDLGNLTGLAVVGASSQGTFLGATPIHLPDDPNPNVIGRINIWNPEGWEGLRSFTSWGYAQTCPEDVNGDGYVDVLDLLQLLAAWGNAGGPEDINGDGVVDVLDLLMLLAAWGPCDPMGECEHEVVMFDDYGDGWNGGFIDIYINGALTYPGVTLPSGAGPESFTFMAPNGGTIETVFTPGGWPYECFYYIYDGAGAEICSDGVGGFEPTGCTCTGYCP